MSEQQQQQNKAVWGPAYWLVLHNQAERFKDTASFTGVITSIGSNLPCDDCTQHSKEFFTKHPLTAVKTKPDAKRYVCEWHNMANEYAGKPKKNCDELTNNNDASASAADSDNDKSTQVNELVMKAKKQEEDFINELSDIYGLPHPQVYHAPCPDDNSTSCVYWGNDDKVIDMYVHPYAGSVRQRLHEFDHYKSKVQTGEASSEESASNFSYDTLNRVAPNLVPKTGTGGKKAGKFAADALEDDKVDMSRISFKNIEKIAGLDDAESALDKEMEEIDRAAGKKIEKRGKGRGRGRRAAKDDLDHRSRFEDAFPLYAMVNREEEQKRKDEEKKKTQGGALSALDPVYESYAKALGIQAPGNLINLAVTPQIFENITMTLTESMLNPLGSSLVSMSIGVLSLLVGIVGRKSLVQNDQLMLQNISASFLWRTLQFLNPKYRMKEVIEETATRVMKGKISPYMLVETPSQYLRAYRVNAPANVSGAGGGGGNTVIGDTGIAVVPQGTPYTANMAQGGGGGGPGGGQMSYGGMPIGIDDENQYGEYDTEQPAQYMLSGDDYYDTDFPAAPRNIHTGQADLTGSTANYARGGRHYDEDLDYD